MNLTWKLEILTGGLYTSAAHNHDLPTAYPIVTKKMLWGFGSLQEVPCYEPGSFIYLHADKTQLQREKGKSKYRSD